MQFNHLPPRTVDAHKPASHWCGMKQELQQAVAHRRVACMRAKVSTGRFEDARPAVCDVRSRGTCSAARRHNGLRLTMGCGYMTSLRRATAASCRWGRIVSRRLEVLGGRVRIVDATARAQINCVARKRSGASPGPDKSPESLGNACHAPAAREGAVRRTARVD